MNPIMQVSFGRYKGYSPMTLDSAIGTTDGNRAGWLGKRSPVGITRETLVNYPKQNYWQGLTAS